MRLVDVRFPLLGREIPVDHGYQLFSAISRIIPQLHGDASVALHPVSGNLLGNRLQSVEPRRSFLTIRLPVERVSQVLPLAGKPLRIGRFEVRAGVPETRALNPSSRLYSRLVVVKGFMEPHAFLEAARRQLDALAVKGKPLLIDQLEIERANRDSQTGSRSPYLRRTIRIRDKEVVGFALRVVELNAEESLTLQERGLGGRRRFGCGVFVPNGREDS